MEIDLPVVDPRWYQLRFWQAVDSGKQFNIISWPRRAGKDLATFSIVVQRALRVPGNYYYYFPTLAWAQRALWDNICEWAGGKRLVDLICPPSVVKKKNNTEYYIDLINGSRIKLGGTDNLDFVGQGGAGYVLSEYSLHKDDVTGYLMPILDQSDAWLIANGTMRGKNNHLYKLWKNNESRDDWFVQWLTLQDTKTNYWVNEEEGICINPELVDAVDPDTGKPFKNIQDYVDSGGISFVRARQEFLNLADSEATGAYYGYEMRKMRESGRILPLDPANDLVYTFWDLGGDKQDSDKTCIVFAQYDSAQKKARVVDYYENTGKLRGHYWDVISGKGYDYGGHFVPHDAKRSNAWSGEGFAETAESEYGVEVRYIPKTNSVMNDIEITRRGFAWTEMDSERCEQLIDALSLYHESETTQKPCHRNSCVECRGSSHAADSFRYMHSAIELGIVEPYLETESKYDYDMDSVEDVFLV